MQPQRRQPAIKNIPPAATPANQEEYVQNLYIIRYFKGESNL